MTVTMMFPTTTIEELDMTKARGKGRPAGKAERELARFSARIFQDQLDALEQYERDHGVTPTRFIRDAIDTELDRRGVKRGKAAR
jgi:hypothetical protein